MKIHRLVKEKQKFYPHSKPIQNAIHVASKFLDGTARAVFVNQLKNQDRKPTGRRHSDDVKLFAIALEAQSPKAYNYMSGIFTLPSQTRLNEIKIGLNLNPGLMDNVINAVQKKEVYE